MGAIEFSTTGYGLDSHDAFANARTAAAWEHGHGGYTGTIAEKTGFVVTTPVVFPDVVSAKAHANDLLWARDARVDDKRGPAGAVRFIDNDPDPNAPADHQAWLFFGNAAY